MIIRKLQLTVNNDKASLNEPVTIYLGDKNICLHIALKQVKYLFNTKSVCELEAIEQCHSCEVFIEKPNSGGIILIPKTEVKENLVHIYVDATWTDELLDLGKHEMQIVLYSNEENGVVGRITLPSFTINVARPLTFTPKEEVQVASEILTEEDEEILTETENGVRISQLVTTAHGVGYIPIVQNGNTYKYNLNTNDFVTEQQDLSLYATKTYVTESIANAKLDGDNSGLDLTGYVTEEELDGELLAKADKEHTHYQYLTESDVPKKTSQLTNDSNFMTSTSIIGIEVVDELPAIQKNGVLYVVRGE